MSPTERHNRVMKCVLGGLLLGWFIKMPTFFWTYFNSTLHKYPMSFELFPSVFENPFIAQVFYFLPSLTVFAFFIKPEKWRSSSKLFTGASLIFLLSSIVLMLHSATYNDATFVTSFWVSLWLTWFSCHRQEEHWPHACTLALALVSVIFLGGFIGKCSADWWSGKVLYGIIQSFFNHWPFEWLKNNTTFEELETISKVMSWSIIFIELVLASCVFWRRSIALKYVPWILLGIVFFRTWRILSVISSFMAVLWACLYLLPSKTAEEAER